MHVRYLRQMTRRRCVVAGLSGRMTSRFHRSAKIAASMPLASSASEVLPLITTTSRAREYSSPGAE